MTERKPPLLKAMRLCFGAAWLVITGMITTTVATDFCRERCCFSYNSRMEMNSTATETKTDSTSSCIKECRLSQELRNISDKELCAEQNKTINDTQPINNVTRIKDLSCRQMFKEGTSNFVGVVRGVQINFYKMTGNNTYYYVNVTWNPFNASDPSKNWSHYVIIWRTEQAKPGNDRCDLVPKDQTFFLINSSNLWQYPWGIELNVSTYPLKKDAGYTLGIYARPKIKVAFIDNPFPEDTGGFSSALMAAIVIGSFVGFALFVSVVVAWKLNVRVHMSENIFLRYIKSLERNRKKELSKTDSEMTVVEDVTQCYLSYFHEDEQYIQTVVAVLQDLSLLGYDIKFNKTHSTELIEEGMDRWAQNQITNSSKIIVLCSPSYIKICQKGAAAICNDGCCEWNRVWFEIQLIGSIYMKRKSASKVICLWMNNGVPDGLPPWMGVTYTWPQDLEKIVQRLKKHSSGTRRSTNRDSQLLTSCIQFNNDMSIDDDDDDDVFT